MSHTMERISFDPDLMTKAVEDLRLHTPDGNADFKDKHGARVRAFGSDITALMRGFSDSSLKKMRSGDIGWPRDLPRILICLIYEDTRIDVTGANTQAFFDDLKRGLSLDLEATPHNEQPDEKDRYTIKNLRLEVQEIRAKVPAPNDSELDLRIGFDEMHLVIDAPGAPPEGRNRFCAETQDQPSAKGETVERDYTGHFNMRFDGREPLSWHFTPEDGVLLKNTVRVEGAMAQVETARGTPLLAWLTAPRDALCVRIVELGGAQRASHSQAEAHRNKMCAAVARKDLCGGATEYTILEKSLWPDDKK